VGGETVFRQTAEAMAAHIDALLDAGADLVGGCCGTTPDHIAAMRAAVDTRLARSA
jgi:5-methyltetrahydrofolate--homocysteine methyltransferase